MQVTDLHIHCLILSIKDRA